MVVARGAALAVVRRAPDAPRVLLGHLGGPLWTRKARSWSIPKGIIDDDDEPPAAAARRELLEETGYRWPEQRELTDLGEFRVTRAKLVRAFLGVEPAGAAAWTPADFTSNTFELEWPPRSGRRESFPEMDRAEFCPLERAREIVAAGQVPIIDAIARALA